MPSETDGPLLRKRPPVVYEPSLELMGSRVLDASEESKLGKQTPRGHFLCRAFSEHAFAAAAQRPIFIPDGRAT
jgi:hypothetical protein